MSETTHLRATDIRVPKWLVTVILTGALLISAGATFGTQLANRDSRLKVAEENIVTLTAALKSLNTKMDRVLVYMCVQQQQTQHIVNGECP